MNVDERPGKGLAADAGMKPRRYPRGTRECV